MRCGLAHRGIAIPPQSSWARNGIPSLPSRQRRNCTHWARDEQGSLYLARPGPCYLITGRRWGRGVSLWSQSTLQLWPGIVLYCHRRSRVPRGALRDPPVGSLLMRSTCTTLRCVPRGSWLSLTSRQKGLLTTTSVRGFHAAKHGPPRTPVFPAGGHCRCHASYSQWGLRSTTSYCTS